MDRTLKYTITTQTEKFYPTAVSEINLLVTEPDEFAGFACNRTSILTIVDEQNINHVIKLDWHHGSLHENLHTLIIPETGRLFFGTEISWGIIDLLNWRLIKFEQCVDFWSIEKRGNTIVVITELYAESLDLTGKSINRVPIDPPFESQDFEDRIEFESPVFGKQTLKLNKNVS